MSKQRSINLLGAISIGVGGMVGGGIFAVLGEAVSLSHGATALAFFFSGIIALLTSYSYAKLSVAFQSEGGTVSFIDNAFGHNLLSGSINLMLWLSYIVTISLYAVAFASYGSTFFSDAGPLIKHFLISFAILLPAIINLVSASFVSKSETFIVIIKVILLVVIIVSSVNYVDTERFSPEHWGSFPSIVVAGMIIFVAYEGFELIANAAEEVKNPAKNLPLAFYSSVVFVMILYILIALVSVGTVPEDTLLKAKDYALAIAAKPALGEMGFIMVSVAALLATFSAINASIYGNSRLGYFIAMEGELPKVLTHSKNSIPFMGVLSTLGFSLILANSINIDEIAIIGSSSFLLIFFIVNLSALKLRKEIQANIIILLLSSTTTFIALCTLLYHTYSSNPKAIYIFIFFILFSIGFEFFYGRLVRGHLFKRSYT